MDFDTQHEYKNQSSDMWIATITDAENNACTSDVELQQIYTDGGLLSARKQVQLDREFILQSQYFEDICTHQLEMDISNVEKIRKKVMDFLEENDELELYIRNILNYGRQYIDNQQS